MVTFLSPLGTGMEPCTGDRGSGMPQSKGISSWPGVGSAVMCPGDQYQGQHSRSWGPLPTATEALTHSQQGSPGPGRRHPPWKTPKLPPLGRVQLLLHPVSPNPVPVSTSNPVAPTASQGSHACWHFSPSQNRWPGFPSLTLLFKPLGPISSSPPPPHPPPLSLPCLALQEAVS